MKTIKVEIVVSGYLEDGNYESFDSEKESMSVECIDAYDETGLVFLQGCMPTLGKMAVEKWKQKREDFKNA